MHQLYVCDALIILIRYCCAIERVQASFLKYLSFRLNGSYPGRGSDYSTVLYSSRLMFSFVTGVVDSASL